MFNTIIDCWTQLNKTKLIIVLGLLIGIFYWAKKEKNINQWTFVSKTGIRLPKKFEIHGIDVSHHQGRINWSKVAKFKLFEETKIEFVYLKATEGTSLIDRQFAFNWDNCKKFKLKRGAYHFYQPWRDATKQADNFVKNVPKSTLDLPPVFDFEKESNRGQEKTIEDISTWLNLVENHFGKKPIIYTNLHFYKKYFKNNFEEYPLWIADYSNQDLGSISEKRLIFWQHNRAGFVDGISEKVDFNVFLQDKDELERL